MESTTFSWQKQKQPWFLPPSGRSAVDQLENNHLEDFKIYWSELMILQIRLIREWLPDFLTTAMMVVVVVASLNIVQTLNWWVAKLNLKAASHDVIQIFATVPLVLESISPTLYTWPEMHIRCTTHMCIYSSFFVKLINDERYGRREEGLVVSEGEAVTQLVSTVSTGSPGPPLLPTLYLALSQPLAIPSITLPIISMQQYINNLDKPWTSL